MRPLPAFVVMTGLMAAAILAAYTHTIAYWSWVAWASLPLVLVNAIWISGGASTAVIGLMQPRAPRRAVPVAWVPTGRTAVVMAVCGEDAQAIADHLDRFEQGLHRSGLAMQVQVFVLSDTSGDEVIAREERALADLMEQGRIIYRRRVQNTGKKPGNIADWLDEHGDRFDHMLVLDADSRMSVDRVRRMIWQLECKPDTGLIQAGIGLVPARSGFGRHQRRGARLLSQNFGREFAAWSGTTSNYWGHNAIMRVDAFRAAAKLPHLSGKAPFGGPLLSHDFIEAAWMKRAGRAVELDPDFSGSAEDAPQTFQEYFRRDRRWCQGNLQHVRLLGERGLHPISRFHLLSGILSYLAGVIWLTFIVTISLSALDMAGTLPLILVGSALLVPKICALLAMLPRAGTVWRRRVILRAWFVELGLSTVLAPIVMLHQAAAVGSVLIGQDSGWKSGRKTTRRLPLGVP